MGEKEHWLIYFTVPISILFSLSSINDIFITLGYVELPFFRDQNFNTYLLLIIAFLFYFIAFRLLGKNKDILPIIKTRKYKNSNLNLKLIEQYKSNLIISMEKDKLFLNGKLSMQDVSEKLDIPRQYISEVLNEHMETSFQDFVNQYRVEEFIIRLKNEQNNHFTLLAIATEVGFNSKSSFNAIFKKNQRLNTYGIQENSFLKTLICAIKSFCTFP